MKNLTIIGCLFLVGFFSCVQKSSNKKLDENSQYENRKLKSGLTINNGINRGTGYKDSIGTHYNIRYIPIKIKNDSTYSVKLHIKFDIDYLNPLVDGSRFNIIPLKKEWAVDGGEITERMFAKLNEDIVNPQINRTLKPGEEFLFGIGTRYHVIGNDYVAPLPQKFFVQSEVDSAEFCESLFSFERTESDLGLGLKLVFNIGKEDERCVIIPCGQITYVEN